MSEYSEKRIKYVNEWPNVEPFEEEKKFSERCDRFVRDTGTVPFLPMIMWQNNDKDYQIYISKLIDALEMMPKWPNRAFSFIFGGFDYLCSENINTDKQTKNIKRFEDCILHLSQKYESVCEMLSMLFAGIPMSATAYLFRRIKEEGKVKIRITLDENNHPFSFMADFWDKAVARYDLSIDDSRRKAAGFTRKFFTQEVITIGEIEYNVTDQEKLRLLVSGFIYTLRNDTMHGSSISVTKSSLASVKRYALNFYAFLSLYTLTTIYVIEKYSDTSAEGKYKALLENLEDNLSKMKLLFGNHLES